MGEEDVVSLDVIIKYYCPMRNTFTVICVFSSTCLVHG